MSSLVIQCAEANYSGSEQYACQPTWQPVTKPALAAIVEAEALTLHTMARDTDCLHYGFVPVCSDQLRDQKIKLQNQGFCFKALLASDRICVAYCSSAAFNGASLAYTDSPHMHSVYTDHPGAVLENCCTVISKFPCSTQQVMQLPSKTQLECIEQQAVFLDIYIYN